MSADAETQLRQLFQNPLQEFQQWKPSIQMILETPEPALAHIEVANLLLSSEPDTWFVFVQAMPAAACSSWKGLSSMAGNPPVWRSILRSSCSRMSYFLPSIGLIGVVNWIGWIKVLDIFNNDDNIV